MERTFRHVVLFQCRGLSDDQRRKVESYFQVRRKSGGGECGSVVQVQGDVYSITFKDKTDQQRVLQRSQHVVDAQGGSLVLTVRDGSSSGDPSSSGPSATSRVDAAASLQEQRQKPNPSPRPPHQDEHEVHLDRYVVRYLKESPDVRKEVDRKLSSMSCSVSSEKDEMVVVSHDVPLGAASEVANWKVAVDEVFESFMCHYEVDSRKVKALLQSCSSRQSSDGAKVYSEIGVAVVVGERLQVSAVLKEMEDSLVKQKASGAGEKRTSTHRLGEAKLRLLSDDIKSSLGEKFPDVEVRQGDGGQLVLSGSVEEIANAGKLISHMEDLVLERIVSDKSPHFLLFLRKAYGAPGALGTFLYAGCEVEMEIGDVELHLFSLFRNKLDETVKKIEDTFKDVKLDIPNCSVVPAELMEQLRSKSNEMNQGSCRVEVVLGLDSSVWLLGHTEEVLELCETVTQFILDQASTKGKAALPFPQLVQLLPDLLQLHDFDHSGVTLDPLASASGPVVALEGPAGKVTEVKNRLDSFLGTLVHEKITIDCPGAVRFFKSPSGRESLVAIARAQRSLIQLEEPPQALPRQSPNAKYTLQNGMEVVVCQGDITQQCADALVNAANEHLEHGGGLAAALSSAGGPQVQIESTDIVRQRGKIPTGNAVVTTSGNLKCRKLIHAVGPVNGQAGGQERPLLEKTVRSALDLAERMDFKSIAVPCISSGLFGVPLVVCSDAIVSAVKTFGSQGGRSLKRIILIDTKADVVGAMQDACDRLLLAGSGGVKQGAAAEDASREASAAPLRKNIDVEILYGTLEIQQADVLVSPLAGLNLTSTRVGIALLNVSGPQLKVQFDKLAAPGSKAGDIFVVENLTALKCKAVIFIWLTTWDNKDFPMQVLRQGIRETLSCCDVRGFTSVAFPLLGTGQLLGFPPSVASKVLLEEIRTFEQQRRNSQRPFVVRVVIHPKNKESYKAFKSAQDAFHSGGATSDPARGLFYHCTSVTTDRITAMLGNVSLQVVQGNITNGGTDVIVNSTDFSNNNMGVSKAILEAAGPSVQQELAKAGVPADLICSTGPGTLGCKEIIHAVFRNDSQTIRKNCKKIVKQCESRRYQSVAFPAVNTGQGGMDAAKACRAMLDGMAAAIKDLKPQSLSLIRIVILQPTVFKAFRTELESRFGQDAPSQVSMKEKAKQRIRWFQDRPQGTVWPSAPRVQTILSSKPPRAVMSVISCAPDTVLVIQKELEDVLHQQQLERQVDVKHISRLEATEVDAVQAAVKALAVSLEHRKCHDSGAGRYVSVGSGPGKEVYVLKGLKEDVLSVVELINKSINTVLCQDLRDKEAAMTAFAVQWSIKDAKGTWQELSLHDNYKLEEAHIRKQASADVMTPTGSTVSVNLKTQEATDSQSGNKYQVKRSQSETALELPPHWEPMNDEVFKRVELQKQSEEYNSVAQGFLKTAKYTIQKVERVQNVYLWHAYSVCRQRILQKNGPGNLGEKLLYHGTSAESCDCIEKDKFDRNYAGAHAAVYGKGVYFAVNAGYSAGGYSPADKSGLKRLYAARVVTGRYTAGKASMVAPPPRGPDPTDCYDSLVDKTLLPTMFVVFHDDQAYPEYRITFK